MTTHQEDSNLSETTSYEEKDCPICLELSLKKDIHYAHLKAIAEAHIHANIAAELLAVYTPTEDYVDYYLFFYGREYRKHYTELLGQYRKEYCIQLLDRMYMPEDKMCGHHEDELNYRFEFRD